MDGGAVALTLLVVNAILLTADDGHRLGIPGFMLWPFCSLLGFFLAVTLSALVLKTAITTAIVLAPRR